MKKNLFLAVFAAMLAITFHSCIKVNQAPINDDPTNRVTEPSLGKSALSVTVDSLEFGTLIGGNFAHLYVRDNDNDSLLRIEIDWQTDYSSKCTVDSENLIGDATTINWYPHQTADSTWLQLYHPNQRQISIEMDSSWENVYALGVKKINAMVTSKTMIIYSTDNSYQSKSLLQTDTASRRQAIETINSVFLNDLSQPNIDSYLGTHKVLSCPCWIYILRPKDW